MTGSPAIATRRRWSPRDLLAVLTVAAILASSPGVSPRVSAQDVAGTDAADASAATVDPTATERPVDPMVADGPIDPEAPVDPHAVTEEPSVAEPFSEEPIGDPAVDEQPMATVEATATEEPAAPATEEPIPPTTEPVAPVEATSTVAVEPTETVEPSPSPSPTAKPRRTSARTEFSAAAGSTLTMTLTLSPSGAPMAGTSVTGQATWSSIPGGIPTGTITYRVFIGSNCTGTVFAEAGAKTIVGTPLPNGSVPASDAVVMTAAGSFSWQASYGGDVNYNAGSVCANQTITVRTTTLALAISPSSGAAGDAFTGMATLTNATATASGSLTYSLYTNNLCTTALAATGIPNTKTVTAGVAPASDPITINYVPTVYWKAVYAGDANNTTASSACVAVPLVKRSPTLSLTVSSPTGVAGQGAAGQATLANATTNAVGTVTYGIYTESTCTTVLSLTGNTHTKTVAAGVVPVGNTLTVPSVTTYWKASYAGDSYNNAAVSACVLLTLAKASPTISLVVTPTLSPMKAAGTAKGQGTLSSTGSTAATATAGGTAIYNVYKDSACSVIYIAGASKTVASRAVPVSSTTTINLAGTVYWQVVYAGDANNNGATSACVALAVAKADPTSALTITPGVSPMKAGGTARARGTFGTTTTTSTVTGTIKYGVYTDSACTTVYALTGNPQTTTVTNRSTATSSSFTFAVVGTYYWRMDFLGDANNNPANGPCTAMVVAKSTPTLTLTITPSVPPMRAGGTAYAKTTMTLSNATASGSATYSVYSDSACATILSAPGSPSTVTVTNKVVPDSALATFAAVGTVYWRLAYAGDANNSAAQSACVALVVGSAAPTLTLTTSPSGSVAVGLPVTGSATLTGATSDAGGTATYTVYADNVCSSPRTVAGSPSTVTVVNRVVPSSAAVTFSIAGTDYWRVSYSGDANNGAATSGCVALTVTKKTPTLGLVVTHPVSPMSAGGTAYGQATLSEATGNAGGTATYAVYTDNLCTNPVSPAKTSTETVANAVVGDSDSFTFDSLGTFYWLAVYSGDANNDPDTSGCIALNVVDGANSSIDVVVKPNPIAAGGTAHGEATLGGVTGSAGGTVTYTVYADSGCTTQVSPPKSSIVTVVNSVVPPSDSLTLTQAGTRYWAAVYSGDANNDGDASSCVALTVNKASPTISIAVGPSPVRAGSGAVGMATLTGATATASGTATYTVYANNSCTTQVSPAQASAVAVANAAVPASAALTVQTAGTVYWRVAYGGDANNNPAASPCTAVTVTKATPMLALTLSSSSVTVWGTASGSAALAGTAAAAGGSVVYTVYDDGACASASVPAKTSAKTVSAGAVPSSTVFMFTNAGVAYWQAVYSGDANNDAAESGCVPLAVNGGSLTASVSSVSMPPVGFSNAQQTNTGTIVLDIIDQRGTSDGWSVTLSVSDFVYSGTAPNPSNIPAGSFSIQTAGGPVYVRGQAIDGANGPMIPVDGATGPLDQPIVVLVANDGYGAGEYTQTYTVVLVIPAGSKAGTYTAVVDTTMSAAP